MEFRILQKINILCMINAKRHVILLYCLGSRCLQPSPACQSKGDACAGEEGPPDYHSP
jgi:hypothetical protein